MKLISALLKLTLAFAVVFSLIFIYMLYTQCYFSFKRFLELKGKLFTKPIMADHTSSFYHFTIFLCSCINTIKTQQMHC